MRRHIAAVSCDGANTMSLRSKLGAILAQHQASATQEDRHGRFLLPQLKPDCPYRAKQEGGYFADL